MNGIKVLLLEDDPDLVTVLRLLIQKNNSTCLSYSSVAELITERDQALNCDVAFLDVDLGRGLPSGIDCMHWLQDEGFGGRIYFLTGHGRNHPLMSQICPTIEILSKPVAPQVLMDSINGCLV